MVIAQEKHNKIFKLQVITTKKKKSWCVIPCTAEYRTGLAWNKVAGLTTAAQRRPSIERAVTRVILIAIIVMEMDLFVITSPKSGASDGVCH